MPRPRHDDTSWSLDVARPERLARHIVTSMMAELGIGAGQQDDAELAIEELVANARLHAPGPYELRVQASEKAVTFAVRDGGGDHASIMRRLTQAATAAPSRAEHGRGLQIVAALFPGACGACPAGSRAGGATRGGATRGRAGAGKQVWISVPIPIPVPRQAAELPLQQGPLLSGGGMV
jgi:anti-sigma regulatory factor (Ser/Thr protein kinase)